MKVKILEEHHPAGLMMRKFLGLAVLRGLRNQISSSAHSGVVRRHLEFLLVMTRS